MKEIKWICIGRASGRMKQEWYNQSTLSYTRKDSIYILLGEGSFSWKEAKGFGWRCVKVEVTITEI
jgi:hypothetical protein